MRGLREILERCALAVRQGQPAVLATVVQVAGSAYRRPGARMLFPAEGPSVGLVSGGCLEQDLAERAREVLDRGLTRTVVYDMRSPDDIVWGLGLGCNGEVRVLLERLSPPALPPYLQFMRECLERRECGVVITPFGLDAAAPPGEEPLPRFCVGSDGRPAAGCPGAVHGDALAVLRSGRSAVRSYGPGDGRGGRADAGTCMLLEHVRPVTRLVVLGAGSDARPLVRLAAELGWSVTLLDPRPAYATGERFPEADVVRVVDIDRPEIGSIGLDPFTAVVVMTHHFLHDLAFLQALLGSGKEFPYLGLIGPRQRTENLLTQLASRGHDLTAGQRRRLHGPVGLDVGAESPEEIALSILAEIQAVLARRTGGFLRDREAPLHDP